MKKVFNYVYGFTAKQVHLKLSITAVLIATLFFQACKKNSIETTGNLKAQNAKLVNESVSGDEFTIVFIPDAQYYTAELDHAVRNGKQQMFKDQISWILANKTTENIAYVAGLGDQVDGGDDTNYTHLTDQWVNASSNGGFYSLDNIIPYGVSAGNHEMLPTQQPLQSPLTHFNQYFGVSHFTGKLGYQGSANNSGTASTTDNRNHYDFFTAGGVNFIVIYIEFDNPTPNLTLSDGVYNWASNLLTTYSSRKAIVITHYAGSAGTPTPISAQGQKILTKLRSHSNFFMMVGGHVDGEGSRQDTYNGKTVKTFISDYQFYADNNGNWDGGAGYMRLMKISVAKDLISVRTISPYIINNPTFPSVAEITDTDSKFSRPLFHQETATRFCDFSQDGKTDFGFFDASTGDWNISGLSVVNWGVSGDLPCPMDYNGDGKTDYAVFRPSAGKFYINGQPSVTWGQSGDIPVSGDYDGDGSADCAVWRPSNFTWYWYGEPSGTTYGAAGDIPTPGDYDGDGKTDFSVYRPSENHWYIYSQTGQDYGTTGDIPVPGDYNGDGKTDIALYRPSNGSWYRYGQTSIPAIVTPATGDIPAPGDYFGAGKTQPAIYRPSNHTLYKYNNGTVTTTVLNAPGSLINLPYAIRHYAL